MRSVRLTGLGVLVAVLLCAAPAVAIAGWPFLGTRGETCLGFGAEYPAADGSTATHRGVDLAAAPGDTVHAPLAGTVSFAGRIPGVGGGTVLAVTLRTATGDITLLPLFVSDVVRGQELSQGASIGFLAEGGDGSSSRTHLHVGLRAGSLYLDPTTVLGVPPEPNQEVDSPTQQPNADENVVPVVVPEPEETGVSVRAGDPLESTPKDAHDGVHAAQPTAQPVPSFTAALGAPVILGEPVAQGAAELAPGVTLAANDAGSAAVTEPDIAASASRALAAGSGVARATSAAVMGAGPGAALSRVVNLAQAGARVLVMLGIALLMALGALWPLWRSRAGEGPGKVPVRGMGEDVAAVASR